MGSVDLDYLKQGFASLVQQAERTTLPTFILWLDLKVAEYKVNGFMILDENRGGEGWLEVIHRCRNQAQGTIPGYHFHPGHPFTHHGPPGNGPPDHVPGGQNSEHIHNHIRGSEPNERIPPSPYRPPVPEHGESGHQNSNSQQLVHIKPEPPDLGFEKLQENIRNERLQQSWYSGALKRSLEYPLPRESAHPVDMPPRDSARPLPLDYPPSHPERNLIVPNHDGHEPMQTDFRVEQENRNRDIPHSERMMGILDSSVRDREREGPPLPNSDSGFFKMTPSPNGMPLVSRQTTNRCPICNRIFHYYSSFNRHMKLHQGIFTHVCEVCRRKFTRKEHFVRHKCHRRPNKPSRMAEPYEGENSLGSSGEPLVQPPPLPHPNQLSPREGSAPPPLIHVSDMPGAPSLSGLLSQPRNPFTYDTFSFSEGSNQSNTSGHNAQPARSPAENEKPVVSEGSSNSKHRRKTTTPMKVEAFMEPPPSLDPPGDIPGGKRSPEDIPDSLNKTSPHSSVSQYPIVNYRRASSSDIHRVSCAAAEFSNISRPESRNSEPAQSSHNHWGYDLSMEPESKSPKENRSSIGGPTREEQYPILKRKVLEAASTLQKLENDMNNCIDKDCNNSEEKAENDTHSRNGQESEVFLEQPQRNGVVQLNHEADYESQPKDLSTSGTPSGPHSRGSSSPTSRPNSASTNEAETPTANASTPPSSNEAQTPSSAPAMSPHGNQLNENQTPDSQMDQHTLNQSPGEENSLCLNNTSPCMPSAYATSEPSTPPFSAKKEGDIHCPSCSRTFLHHSSLNRHMKLHQGIFTHACALCNRKFTRKEHFVNHKCSRRPRNPTRVMAPMEPQSLQGQPQRVEYPPSVSMPRPPSPPGGSNWDTGSLNMGSGGGLAALSGSPLASPLGSPTSPLIPVPGPPINNENNISPTRNSSSPEHRRPWKLKGKW